MTPAAASLRGEAAEAWPEYLLALADDEFILGHRHAEWTGFGPDVESDVALSSIAQEEMGHARLFYRQILVLAARREEDLDAMVFDRPATEFRHATLLERPNSDWGFTIVRLFLYELADAVRLETLRRSAASDLPALAGTLQREEKYHRMYGETWLARLARATPDSRARVRAALDAAWPEALALFEPTAGEPDLLAAGLLAESSAGQRERWRGRVAELLSPLDLTAPDGAAAAGGRRGKHSADLETLLEEMTAVRRMEPGARW